MREDMDKHEEALTSSTVVISIVVAVYELRSEMLSCPTVTIPMIFMFSSLFKIASLEQVNTVVKIKLIFVR